MSLITGSDSGTRLLFSLLAVLPVHLDQVSSNQWLTYISLLSYVFFIVLIFYGQRIQMYVMIREVENSLHKLKYIKEEGRKITIEAIKEIGKPTADPSTRVDRFLEYFTIAPQNMDPAGIVYKLDHILDVRDDRMKDEVKLMAPASDEVQVNNLENTLEAAMALNFIYKVIRHYYIQGKKTLSLYVIMQIQMILPMVMKEAEAYASALKAFAYGQPIGDGAGPLVAAKLMHGYETRKLQKDCVMATVPFAGRTALVIKAEGPGGNVGKPGDAVETVIEENEGKIGMVVMIDAGLKLEGETVGEVAEGIGAAIGGPGVDQYKIEDKLTKYKIPIMAVIIKEDIGDAVSPMRKEINDAVDPVIERVRNVVLERTKEGDKIIIVGVGNSIGVGQ
ncbi:MAG TPA: DUF1512 domain-containing protein [Candidatus Limnocylindrales bacterium]|nr:DUF1512 domain-containing protein [Candidatus Limnocylindrales bacterium]